MLRSFRKRRRDRLLEEHPLEEALWGEVLEQHPIFARLDGEERLRLREFTTLFLAEKRFEPEPGLEPAPLELASIAAQACLPVLALGYDWLDDWATVVLHEGLITREREDLLDGSSTVCEAWQEDLSGEAEERGPIFLSIEEVDASGWGEGYNVVIHEVAHKLDMKNGGSADGCPPFDRHVHRGMDRAAWAAAFAPAFHDLADRTAHGRRTGGIDGYAAEDPAEFFAVASEYFFEQPARLQKRYPAVYAQLARWYLQDPLALPS